MIISKLDKNEKIIVMSSGGIDSTVILYDLYNKGYTNVHPVIVNYGQKNYDTELKSLLKVNPFNNKEIIKSDVSNIYEGSNSKLLKVTNLWEEEFNEEQNDLPGRSMLFALIGLNKAKEIDAKVVFFGFIDTNNVINYDCKEEYLFKLFELLYNEEVRFEIPFIKMTKEEVVKYGYSIKTPLGKTYSCHNNIIHHCGACPNCLDRIKAFDKLVE